jgi:hypothetical protein
MAYHGLRWREVMTEKKRYIFSSWEKILEVQKELLIMCLDLREIEFNQGIQSPEFISKQALYKKIVKSKAYAD